MSKRLVFLLPVAAALLIPRFVGRAADEEKPSFKAICPVSGKDINKDASVKYKGADVYFCCPGCPDEFKKNTEKYASKANHQLAGTKQFVQAKCPLTGNKLNPETGVDVAGLQVTFCCNNCKGKAEGKEGDERLTLVFNDKAFEKGFKKKSSRRGDD